MSGLLPETLGLRAPLPSSLLVPFAPKRHQLGVPRRPTWADARAAGSRRSASFCHLQPLAPAGTFPLIPSLQSLSELCWLVRSSASNRLPGASPGPGDPFFPDRTDAPTFHARSLLAARVSRSCAKGSARLLGSGNAPNLSAQHSSSLQRVWGWLSPDHLSVPSAPNSPPPRNRPSRRD